MSLTHVQATSDTGTLERLLSSVLGASGHETRHLHRRVSLSVHHVFARSK